MAFVPVMQLGFLVGVSTAHGWRRAKAGRYGKISRNKRGWQVVKLAEVERVENTSFTAAQIATSADRLRQEYLTHNKKFAAPSPPRIDITAARIFSRAQVEEMILGHVRHRDIQWHLWFVRSLNRYEPEDRINIPTE